jgi:hypothetical protein
MIMRCVGESDNLMLFSKSSECNRRLPMSIDVVSW